MLDDKHADPAGSGDAAPTGRLARDLLAQATASSDQNRTPEIAAQPTLPLVATPGAQTRPMKAPPVGRPLPSGAPASIGAYHLLSELGRGAMGAVYLAEERPLGRRVALKVVLPENAEDPELVERFIREAQACAKLRHPHIVTVLGFGEAGGTHYYAMEYVEGRSLADVLRREGMTQARAATLVRQAAEGLSHAHHAGVVHRDVKPQNLMVTWTALERTEGLSQRELTAVAEADAAWRRRGTPADPTTNPTVVSQHQDHVKVADFGLARVMGAKTLTKTQGGMGTPLYMAPEQFTSARRVGPSADVYSLGATLYELLTGRTPFRGDDVGAIQARVENEEPVPPRKLEPKLDKDLEAITLKCLEKDPRRRYAEAGALAQDLGRWLRGEPVLARRVSWAGRLWRRALRQQKVVVPVAAALLVAAALGAWLAVSAWKRGDEARRLIASAAALEAQGDQEGSKEAYGQASAAYQSAWSLQRNSQEAGDGIARVKAKLNAIEQAESDTKHLCETGRDALEDARTYLYGKVVKYDELALRLDKARSSFEQARAKAPRLALPHDLLGRTWKLLGSSDEAEACWREAIRLDASSASAYFRLGVLRLEQYVELRAWSTGGGSKTRRESRAEALLAEAREFLERASSLPIPEENTISRSLLDASLAHTKRDWSRVREVCEASIAGTGDPRGTEWLHLLLGQASVEEGARSIDGGVPAPGTLSHAQQSMDMWEHGINAALAIRPCYDLALLLRAALHGIRGEMDDAKSDLDAAIRSNPRFVMALVFRGVLTSEQGNQDEAILDYNRALEIDSRCGMALMYRASARAKQRDLNRTIADCEKAIDIDPQDSNALAVRGDCRWRKGDMDGGLADLEKAVTIDPQNSLAWSCRGQARAVRGEMGAALADLNKSIELDPENPDSLGERAVIRLGNRDVNGALDDLRKCLTINPRDPKALRIRGIAFLMQGKDDQAIADFDRAIGLDPRDADAHFFRGGTRVAKGDLIGAIEDYSKALEVAPSDWPMRPECELALRAAREKLTK